MLSFDFVSAIFCHLSVITLFDSFFLGTKRKKYHQKGYNY